MRRYSFLPRLSVTRPVTVIMAFIALLAVGYIAYTRIPTQLFPAGFSPPFLGAWVPYQNANPQEVAEQIARPVEEILGTVRGIRTVRSNSSSNGCWFWLEFAQRTDMGLAYSLVRDRLDRVKPDLPEDIRRFYVRKFGEDDDPIVWATVQFDREEADPYNLIDTRIKRRLDRIDGVANIEIWGAYEKVVQVDIDHDKTRAYRVPMFQLIQSLQQDNFSMPSGSIVEGGKRFFVRSLGRYGSIEEVISLPMEGTNLRLGDIASITYGVPERTSIQRVNQKPSVGIGVFKESAANTVELCSRIRDVLEHDVAADLPGSRVEILFDQGRYITESIDNLKGSGLWGGLFAALILLFFLRAFRITGMITLAIPLSLLITVTLMYFIGWSMNLFTLMGLMLGVGMVVDNSIVVVENIYRMRIEGRSAREAAVSGAGEVALAITMATLTSVVVFLPLILMNDSVEFAFIMLRIGLPVIVALLASLLVALLFIPLAASWIIGMSQPREAPMVNRVNAFYQRGLGWALRHRMDATLIVLLLFATIVVPMNGIKKTDEAQGNINDFHLGFDLPDSNTLEETDKALATVETFLFKHEKDYCLKAVQTNLSAGSGRLRVFLKPPRETAWWQVASGNMARLVGLGDARQMTREEVIADVMEKMPRFPGTEVTLGWGEDGGNKAGVTVRLYGNDTPTLIVLAREVERRLKAIPDILSVETDMEKAASEIQLTIDRDRARYYGIGPGVISGTVSSAVRGIELPRYRTEDREVPVRAQFEKRDRETLDQLQRMTFVSNSGEQIPLSALATVRIAKGAGEIHREEGKTVLSVTARTTRDNLKELFARMDDAMTGFEVPNGFSWDKGERYRRSEESNLAQQLAIVLAVTFVFLLMGVLFESFILPLSVLLAIPFAFFGVYWFLYITGTPFDIMAGIGLIILIGVVVNNAIVLIDLVNRMRADGVDRLTAIVDAGKHRFRPILMTTGTTVLGLVPMAAGNSSLLGIPYAPLGRTMIGGLVASTFLTLFVVPIFYTFFDDLRAWWGEGRKEVDKETRGKSGGAG